MSDLPRLREEALYWLEIFALRCALSPKKYEAWCPPADAGLWNPGEIGLEYVPREHLHLRARYSAYSPESTCIQLIKKAAGEVGDAFFISGPTLGWTARNGEDLVLEIYVLTRESRL